MKNILLIFLVFIFSKNTQAEYKCQNKINPDKIVLFVDTNSSPTEVTGAAKAACLRGEAFLKVPSQGDSIEEESLNKEFVKLANQKKSIVSMIVSGHNGGGHFHGIQGSIGKDEIIKGLKESYKNQPELLNDLESVYMWGCWSMGPSEVEIWKKELPSIKLAAGFIDMGPLNTTQASHTVLNGLLIKEKALILEADEKKLKRSIASVENIGLTWASVYTKSTCGSMYYYKTEGSERNENSLFTPGTHFVEFDSNFDCNSMKGQIESTRKELIPYFYGRKELPPDEPNSKIRQMYSFLRKAEHCIKKDHMLNPDRMFLLRFYNEVKENFANIFQDLNQKSMDEFNLLQKYFSKKPTNPALMGAYNYFHKGKNKFFSLDKETLKTKNRKEINEMISFLDGLTKLKVANIPQFKDKTKELRRMKNNMTTYLFEMHPSCMSFLDWHEVEPGYNPQTYCDY